MRWPESSDALVREQRRLASSRPPAWTPPAAPYSEAGCFLCFPRGQSGYGGAGDPAWGAAALVAADGTVVTRVVRGAAGARYSAGMLALREGPLLESAIRRLPAPGEILLVNATGRDHPRRAGLALHLGALLDRPTVGVTHRPLAAEGRWPDLRRGSRAPLRVGSELVGQWLCTRDGARPLAVHAAWRTDPEVAATVVLAASDGRARTPEPIRQARRAARLARGGRSR